MKAPRSVISLEVLRRIERRYRLPEGYFTEKAANPVRAATGFDLDDVPASERRRLAWHLPDDFNSRPRHEQAEILDWVRTVVISGSTDYRRYQAAAMRQHFAVRFPVMVGGAVLFACMDWKHLPELFSAVEQVRLTPLNMCVWAKTNAGMGTFYRSQHEIVLAVKKGSAPHINNFELGKKGRSRSNLWSYRGMNVVGQERDDLLKLHPTVKPVALVADAIKDVSHRGGIVLDPFLGSGTTLIAAESTGRRCCGVEFDPLYCDLIIRRWADHTGASAVLEPTGESFEQREAAALAAATASAALLGEEG